MAVVCRTSPHGLSSEAGVVVVHCSDPRYQWHFHEFLRNGLGIREYGLVAVPGGPQLLARLKFMPKFSWVGWRWLKFLVDLTKPERVVLINHDDCRLVLVDSARPRAGPRPRAATCGPARDSAGVQRAVQRADRGVLRASRTR